MQTNAQNLVQNGDFEAGTCPTDIGQLFHANGWSKDCSPAINSPDLFQLQTNVPNTSGNVCTQQIPRGTLPVPPPGIYTPIVPDYNSTAGKRRYLSLVSNFINATTPNHTESAVGTLTQTITAGYYTIDIRSALSTLFTGNAPNFSGFQVFLIKRSQCQNNAIQILDVPVINSSTWLLSSANFTITPQQANYQYDAIYIKKRISLSTSTGIPPYESIAIDEINITRQGSIDIVENDMTICKGETVKLSTNYTPSNTLPTSYLWSATPNNSSFISSNTIANVVVQPSITTEYTVTAIINGYAMQDKVKITVLDPPTPTIVGSVTNCNLPTSTYTAQTSAPIGINTQYNWTVVGGTYTPNNAQQTAITVNWTGNIGSITLKITNAEPATGKVCSKQTTLQVSGCCEVIVDGRYITQDDVLETITNADASRYFNGRSSIYGTNANGRPRVFVVHGYLNIDYDMTFEGVRFVMNQDAKIEITNPNVTLNLEDCKFRWCQETRKLWEGIIAPQHKNAIVAVNCDFMHAKKCLQSFNGANIDVQNNLFSNNKIDIQINSNLSQANTPDYKKSPLYAVYNEFLVGKNPTEYVRKSASIYIDKVRLVKIGNEATLDGSAVAGVANMFEYEPLDLGGKIAYIPGRMSACIVSYHTEMFITGNTFKEVNTLANTANCLPQVFSNIIRYQPCNVAVWANNYNSPPNILALYKPATLMSKNVFLSGVRGAYLAGGSVNAFDNLFSENIRALEIYGLSNIPPVHLSHNWIGRNKINESVSELSAAKTIEGILIENSNLLNASLIVNSNQIKAITGIRFNYAPMISSISGNRITLIDASYTNAVYPNNIFLRTGIINSGNSSTARINRNLIESSSNFQNTASVGGSDALFGIISIGNAMSTIVSGNTLRNLSVGTDIEGNHSLYLNLTCNKFEKNLHGVYFANQAQIPDLSHITMPGPLGNRWVQNISNYRMAGVLNTNATRSLWYTDNNDPEQKLDNSNIEPPVLNGLDIQQSTDPGNCYPAPAKPTHTTAELREQAYRKVIDNTLEFEQNQEANLHLCHEYTYRALVNNDTLLHTNDPTDQDYIHYVKSWEGTNLYHTNLLYQALQNGSISQAWQHYHNIQPQNILEKTNQIVNFIVLSVTDTTENATLSIYPFDAQQTETLTNIASQNPHEIGEAVIRARVLLGMGADTQKMEGYQSELQKISKISTIVPNPAQSYFDVQMPHTAADVLTILIYDALGKLCHTQEIYHQDGTWRASTANLQNGIYTCKILNKDNDALLGIAKLVITK